jgi:hypothetical protein
MQFINIAMLFGLLAVAIPIIIQIITRKNARRIKWGAWLFLDLTMKKRRRKVLLEDILLLACRCLALGLLALAFARPFVRPDSPVPWAVTMPVLLLSITAIGISFALWRYPKYRLWMMIAGIALFVLSIATVVFERQLNLKRFGLGANKDVVLIVDGSASMSIIHEGKTNFERAVEEAKKYVELAPRNTSFAVIIGGPVPQVMNPVPIADKRVIINTLERIHPANGTMAIAGNLTAASVTLAAGHNAVKQIVIVGDGQAVGWQLEDKERWKTLQRVFTSLKTQPIITWRTLPLPTSIRNLAIAGIRPSREIVGADREVRLDVTVVNAGTEAVTPKGVSLQVEGTTLTSKELHQLEPGESQTFGFTHRFRNPGGTIITAKVESGDDMPTDDVYRYAMPVVGSLKVLVIDGNPGAPFLNRASTYVRLALRPELIDRQAAAGEEAPERNYLVETVVEDVVVAGQRANFAGFSAVIMLGARKVSERTRAALARFVAFGGGLFVMPAPGMDEEFFNDWNFAGERILPAPLGKWRTSKSELDTGSFSDMLARFRTGGDLGTASPESVVTFGENWSSNAVAVAKLKDGNPFLLSHNVGRGTVFLSAAVFDAASGLVSKRGFVPMMHELIYSLSRPAAVQLDVRPSEGLTLLLATGASGEEAAGVNGLAGFYFPSLGFQGKPVVRTDKSIHHKWNASPVEGIPGDRFSVIWRGVVMSKEDGYKTIYWEADDRFSLKIGGKMVGNRSRVEFKAGVPYPIEGRFEEDWGEARVVLFWKDPSAHHGKPIPNEAFATRAGGCEGAGDVVEVTDPHGESFYAEIYQADAGLFLRTSRSIVPGVYSVGSIPDALKDICRGVIGENGKISISVSAGVEESTLTAITQNELSELSRYVQISQAIKDEDVIKAIGGQSFGKEVWRVLAFAAFLFLVAEPAIARWIAKNRRTGDIIDMEGSWIRT